MTLPPIIIHQHPSSCCWSRATDESIAGGLPRYLQNKRQRLQEPQLEAEGRREEARVLGAKSLVRRLPFYVSSFSSFALIDVLNDAVMTHVLLSPALLFIGPTLVILTLTTWATPCWLCLRCCHSRAGWRSGMSSFTGSDRYETTQCIQINRSQIWHPSSLISWVMNGAMVEIKQRTRRNKLFCVILIRECSHFFVLSTSDPWHLHPRLCVPGLYDWTHSVCGCGHCKLQWEQGESNSHW